jgi:hypothetical protein
MPESTACSTRRGFLAAAIALPAAGEAPAPSQLPTVKFGSHAITRLIIGSNPLYGYTHHNAIYNRFMNEYMTQDMRMKILHHAERMGIGTWQIHYNDQPVEDIKRYRREGGKMNIILLADFALMKDPSLLPKVVKEVQPLGIGHHGDRADQRFRRGEMGKVRDFLKAVRDSGVLVGLSAHNPAVFETVESQNWDIDYYQCCLYRVTRTAEEARKEFGEAPVGEIYMERDPERMLKVVRATRKPCVVFKVLAAGRLIAQPQRVEDAFRYAYANMKPSDALIVGMCNKHMDEVKENTDLVRRILAA